MRLGELMRRYAGKAEKQAISESEPGPVAPNGTLPVNTTDWPPEWQNKLKEIVKTLQTAFDLGPTEAEEAALPAVQYEFMKQRRRTRNKESDHE